MTSYTYEDIYNDPSKGIIRDDEDANIIGICNGTPVTIVCDKKWGDLSLAQPQSFSVVSNNPVRILKQESSTPYFLGSRIESAVQVPVNGEYYYQAGFTNWEMTYKLTEVYDEFNDPIDIDLFNLSVNLMNGYPEYMVYLKPDAPYDSLYISKININTDPLYNAILYLSSPSSTSIQMELNHWYDLITPSNYYSRLKPEYDVSETEIAAIFGGGSQHPIESTAMNLKSYFEFRLNPETNYIQVRFTKESSYVYVCGFCLLFNKKEV